MRLNIETLTVAKNDGFMGRPGGVKLMGKRMIEPEPHRIDGFSVASAPSVDNRSCRGRLTIESSLTSSLFMSGNGTIRNRNFRLASA